MREFEWPKDEFGFPKFEHEFTQEERDRHEQHKARQRLAEISRKHAQEQEQAAERRRHHARLVRLRHQARVLEPILDRYLQRYVCPEYKETILYYGAFQSDPLKYTWTYRPKSSNKETVLIHHYPHALRVESYEGDKGAAYTLQTVLEREMELPVELHLNYSLHPYNPYLGRGEGTNSDGYGYYPSAQG